MQMGAKDNTMRKTIFLRFHFQNLKIVVDVHFFSNSISQKKYIFLDLASNNFSLNFNLYAYLFIFFSI